MFTIPVLALKIAPLVVSGPMVRLPDMFMVLLLQLNVPPRTNMSVGFRTLPVLLVQVPLVSTSTEPPMVVFVPATFNKPLVETLPPPTVAVLPVKVMLGLVPSSTKPVPPPTWIPPPWPLDGPAPVAALEVKEVVATVALKLSFSTPPPFPAELFEKVLVPKLAEPVPAVCPLKLAVNSVIPPPLLPATLRPNVVPVEVKTPVEASCVGADGSKPMPAPDAVEFVFPFARSAAEFDRAPKAPGAALPPMVQLFSVRSPPRIWMAPPPTFAPVD